MCGCNEKGGSLGKNMTILLGLLLTAVFVLVVVRKRYDDETRLIDEVNEYGC